VARIAIHASDASNRKSSTLSAVTPVALSGQALAKNLGALCQDKSTKIPPVYCRQASSVAAQPAPKPTAIPGPPPSPAEVVQAVTTYCTLHVCGTPPSAGVVAQAISTYCQANGGCRGSTGVGAPGSPGQSVTADQVAAGVASYCTAHNQCQGPAGASGAAGQNGTDGAAGAPGAAGTDGHDGAPPVAWTYTDPIGMQHTCTRTDPFDPAAPTYQCS
jgi:hypothetical protein